MNKIFYLFKFLILCFLLYYPSKTYAYTKFTHIQNVPIISPVSNTWESQRTAYQNVLYDNEASLFKMWYSGHNGTKWSIGYATSSDGILWNKNNNNPILHSETDNEPKNFLTPFVIKDADLYRMWYTSTPDDATNFRIGYATSQDGINWNKITNEQLVPEPNKGEIAIVSPNVLKINDSDYRMWYVFKGNNVGWKLGYATSENGTTWTKYSNNPVIDKTVNWEGSNIGKSTIIYEDNTFHLWYDTNTPGSAIVYANSYDGINWDKPIEYNPVMLPESTGLNAFNVGAPNIVKLNNINYLFFTALINENNNTYWKISLATDAPIPSPTIIPTPTLLPTVTPSPIPTPTNIPTPTPTPLLTNKVVFIPGFGGSWNQDAILSCNLDTNPAQWQSWFASEQVYNRIFDSLAQSGFEVLPFYYDWRKLPTETASNLRNFIYTNTKTNEKVHIVSHSMGGLIARAYIEQEKENAKIDKLLTTGTPHQGVVQAYPAWSAGQTWGPFYFQIAAELAKFFCYEPGLTQKEMIRKAAPSIQTMLPTFDFLRLHSTNIVKPVYSMIDKNPWLLQHHDFNPPYFGITVGSLAGTGNRTQKEYTYVPQTPLNIIRDEYADGRPVKAVYSTLGDGTVLTESSILNGSWSKNLKLDHTELIRSKLGIQTIIQFLLDSTSLPELSIDSALKNSQVIIANDGNDIEITTPKKQSKKRVKGVITLEDIQDGSYFIRSKGNIGRLLIIQMINEHQIFVKEYSDLQMKKSKKVLRLTNNSITKDPLE